VHNTKTLKIGRGLEKFPEIVARLAGMAGRFCTMLVCVNTGFIPGGLLDELPAASQLGSTRRYFISPGAARTISALLTLREQVIAPLLAGVADPRIRRTPATGPTSTGTTRRYAWR
jgi:hypothetical protein